jgi:uncharacterized repeat protein (TIGR03803 family)
MNTPVCGGLTTARSRLSVVTGILLILSGWAFNANALTVTNIYSFGGPPDDGIVPVAGLVQGSDGNFYGTTATGGTNGGGTVFRISPSGTYTTLYYFASSPTDGAGPRAGLVQGSDGSFYGRTGIGGTSNAGTVFRISPSGTYTSLYSFAGSANDDGYAGSGLVQGSDGNFYGTTEFGGTNGSGGVFRISPSGTFTNLYSFAGYPVDGLYPINGLVQGSDGNFYGTTGYGGTLNIPDIGDGSVFRISPNGSLTTLYSFGGLPQDGVVPIAGLVQGSDGNFYGTTVTGGASFDGTVFRISPNGTYTNLYSFGGSAGDGTEPQAGLVQGSDGNFYGVTKYGGTNDLGIVFRISPRGTYTNLYTFGGYANDGATPAGMLQGGDGNFYGTTWSGGTYGVGTVFRLTVPLNPPPYPINQITEVQLAGSNIVFHIPSIAYETYQLQFSSSMNPTNWINVPGVSVTNSIGALLTLTNFGGASQPQGFYRFDITP